MASPTLNQEMVRTATPDRILRVIAKNHPADLVLLFKDFDPGEVHLLFDLLLSIRRAGKTLKELPEELLPQILELIEDEKLAIPEGLRIREDRSPP